MVRRGYADRSGRFRPKGLSDARFQLKKTGKGLPSESRSGARMNVLGSRKRNVGVGPTVRDGDLVGRSSERPLSRKTSRVSNRHERFSGRRRDRRKGVNRSLVR